MSSDPLYRLWFRLEEPKEEFAGGMWVHTFNRILPSDRFGESHPEYYSFINGKRRPGNAGGSPTASRQSMSDWNERTSQRPMVCRKGDA